MPALVVVDMQARFAASRPDWMIRNVSREIHASASAGHAIIFLEYTRNAAPVGVTVRDTTDCQLTDIVAHYDKAVVAHKSEGDGSKQVVAVLKSLDREPGGDGRYGGEIRVVGVETNICVARTVNGLARRMCGARIVVVGDACNVVVRKGGPGVDRPNNSGQDKIKARRNVTVLKAN